MKWLVRLRGKGWSYKLLLLLLPIPTLFLLYIMEVPIFAPSLSISNRLLNFVPALANWKTEDEREESTEVGGDWGWNESSVYQLVAGDCRIPQVPQNHGGIPLRLKQRPIFDPSKANCSNERVFSALTSSADGQQAVELTDKRLNASDCCVFEISRPFGTLTTHSFGPCISFDPVTRSVPMASMEYIIVQCKATARSANKKQTKKAPPLLNFHVTVPLQGVNSIALKREFWGRRRDAPPPPSVLLLVIDSTSRTEMFRHLPRTLQYMKQLGFVNFKGHHPLGEPTVANLVGLLMGLQGKDFWKAYKLQAKNWWDSAPFLWNIFGKLGYVTGYFEDGAASGTFNYHRQRGFAHQPTDVFNYPFLAAYEQKIKTHKASKRDCFGKQNTLEMVLEHKLQLLEKLGSSTPSFLVSWPCFPQHDFSHSSLGYQDSAYLTFLRRLRSSPSFANTLLIVTSDHAYTHMPYAYTHGGIIERRTMPLFIRLPKALRNRRAGPTEAEPKRAGPTPSGDETFAESLRWNSEGITSHLDVYRTLLHIADLAANELTGGGAGAGGITKYGTSLLRRIPHSRTCKEAGIPKTMCACNLPPILNQSGPVNVTLLQLNRSEYAFPFL